MQGRHSTTATFYNTWTTVGSPERKWKQNGKACCQKITDSEYTVPSVPLLKRLHWLFLPERVKHRQVQLVFKYVKGHQITCASYFKLFRTFQLKTRSLTPKEMSTFGKHEHKARTQSTNTKHEKKSSRTQ